MSCCARVAPVLLLHVALLLALFGGAALATSARLKWDPTTYIAVRELFPLVYRVATVMLLVIAVVLILLGHLAITALRVRRLRRPLLVVYATSMAVMICGEVAFCCWVGAQVNAWLQSEQAKSMKETMAIREHLQPILEILSRWHPLPEKIKQIIVEVEADLPCNGYVAVAALVTLLVLQMLAVTLALLAVCARTHRYPHPHPHTHTRTRTRTRIRTSSVDGTVSVSTNSSTSEKSPLKAVYKNGRLMLL